MFYHPDIHQRRSIRLKGYDYSSEGLYYVTLCVQDKKCLFGSVIGTEMHLNDAGAMVDEAWRGLPRVKRGVELDEYVVMPNHFHGILFLTDGPDPVTDGRWTNARGAGAGVREEDSHSQGKAGEAPISLGEVVKGFKNWTIHQYIAGVKNAGWQRFPGRLWQRNYWDRVIRNERELNNIRCYIRDNPRAWAEDEYHPSKRERLLW
ncbi:MAG: transposase [bacterium]|nr:transposase [bacterium]